MHLVWVELHRRSRQQPEAVKQAPGTERLQQPEQLIRSASKHPASGSMGFIHQHRIPRALDGKETGAPVGTRNEVTGDDQDAVFLPWTICPPHASVDIAQAVPIEKPGRQGKLLTEFFHPLPDETAGSNQQHALEDTA